MAPKREIEAILNGDPEAEVNPDELSNKHVISLKTELGCVHEVLNQGDAGVVTGDGVDERPSWEDLI